MIRESFLDLYHAELTLGLVSHLVRQTFNEVIQGTYFWQLLSLRKRFL